MISHPHPPPSDRWHVRFSLLFFNFTCGSARHRELFQSWAKKGAKEATGRIGGNDFAFNSLAVVLTVWQQVSALLDVGLSRHKVCQSLRRPRRALKDNREDCMSAGKCLRVRVEGYCVHRKSLLGKANV